MDASFVRGYGGYDCQKDTKLALYFGTKNIVLYALLSQMEGDGFRGGIGAL